MILRHKESYADDCPGELHPEGRIDVAERDAGLDGYLGTSHAVLVKAGDIVLLLPAETAPARDMGLGIRDVPPHRMAPGAPLGTPSRGAPLMAAPEAYATQIFLHPYSGTAFGTALRDPVVLA